MLSLDAPELYYLANFRKALAWLDAHHVDLMDDAERAFVADFPQLPLPAQALLVRLVMRKGVHFRAGKLSYQEVGCTHAAATPLRQLGWVDDQCLLAFEEVFALLQKGEILSTFKPWIDQPKGKKADWLASYCQKV